MKKLNLMQKLVWVGIIVLISLFPSWACGTQTHAPTKQQTREAVAAREKIRADAEKMAVGQGLDMTPGSVDYHLFYSFVNELANTPNHEYLNKPFGEQVGWVVEKVKAGRPGAPPVAQVPTLTPGTVTPGIAPPPNQETLPFGPALKKPFIDMSDLGFGGSAPAPPAPPVDTTPIIILLILVILAVVCLVFYFNQRLSYEKQEGGAPDTPTENIPPQLTMTDSQKSEQEKPELIEKQEGEVSDIPLEGKEYKGVIRMIKEASSTTYMIIGLIILLLLFALAMALYWMGETRDYQVKQLQLQKEQKIFQKEQQNLQKEQLQMLEKMKRDHEWDRHWRR